MLPGNETTTATYVFTTGIDGTDRTAVAVWSAVPTTPSQNQHDWQYLNSTEGKRRSV